MTKHPLIYRVGRNVILLDPEYEIRIGVFDFKDQADRAWAIYLAQGRQAAGLDYSGYDWFVTDQWRKDSQQFKGGLHEKRKH